MQLVSDTPTLHVPIVTQSAMSSALGLVGRPLRAHVRDTGGLREVMQPAMSQ